MIWQWIIYSHPLEDVGFPCGLAGKESTCDLADLGLIPGLGRTPREWKSYPLQYSGLENSMACIVYGVTKSWTWLNNFHFTMTDIKWYLIVDLICISLISHVEHLVMYMLATYTIFLGKCLFKYSSHFKNLLVFWYWLYEFFVYLGY